MSSPSGRQRAPVASAQSIHFSNHFSIVWSFVSTSGMPFFFDSFSKYAKMTLVLYMFRAPSLRPCWTIQENVNNPKTSATLHENAPAQKGTNAMLHGNAFRLLMGPQSGPPKSPKPCILKGLERFFANTAKHHLKTWNGRSRDIE